MTNRITGIAFVELWTPDLEGSFTYWAKKVGFVPSSPTITIDEEGFKRSYRKLTQGQTEITLKATTDQRDSEFLRQTTIHGEFVKDVALCVDDAKTFFAHAVTNGAQVIKEMSLLSDGSLMGTISSPCGDIVHSIVQKSDSISPMEQGSCGILDIDHVAIVLQKEESASIMDWYARCLGFQRFVWSEEESDQDGYASQGPDGGLKTAVASSGDGSLVKIVFVESIDGPKKNQIQDFLERNGGPGVQHLAFSSRDIFACVRNLKSRGIEFIQVPAEYYDGLFRHASELEDRRSELEELGILMELSSDNTASLLQTFTSPITSKQTMFLEIISRNGSQGFGKKIAELSLMQSRNFEASQCLLDSSK
eukprot:TRINITY_DN7421_c0_g1_i1.p1 TRINITY_DN7421_c0_g1~~TRINITY_DN7421_c0_g1_i1.p1  ORF type:complete len:364 (+),score=74.78 TRINITY_DN7421_c0_g1_i1:63-1154(+)